MSVDYTLDIAYGVIATKKDLTTLSFLPLAAGENPEVFFGNDTTMYDVFYTVERLLNKVLGEAIAVDISFDQICGNIEESLIFYAPSTLRNLMMEGGDDFPAFNVTRSIVPTLEEEKTLKSLAESLGIDESEAAPVVWGSVL